MHKILIYTVCLSVCFFGVRCDLNLGEGAECEWDGVKGTCVDAHRCLTTIQLRGDKHPVCSQKEDVTFVCCTDCELVNDTSNAVVDPVGGLLFKDGRKFRDNCLRYLKDVPHKCYQEGYYGSISKYYNSKKQCHTYSMWAVGGAPPPGSEPPKENPYEALIGFGDDQESAQWLISGAIVSEKFILTSATGLTASELPLKFVALGVNNRGDKKGWQIHTVKKIYKHPEWKSVEEHARYNNLALLELDTEITFTDDILPACLPDPTEDVDVSVAKYSSWKTPEKKTDEFLDKAKIIKLAEVSAIQCSSKINPAKLYKYLPSGIDASQLLCYEKSDSCLNVIGSPVAVTSYISRCMNTVVGIHTYGEVCNEPTDPAVFTKVAHYVDWIESVVWP